MSEKLQKVIAASGYCSRRAAETLISEGEVRVNGETAHLGQRVEATDDIRVQNKRIASAQQHTTHVIVYNKPLGVLCTAAASDPDNRPTVFDYLPPLKVGRWIAIGRLDINTTGLLLFTNDGGFANQLMHPSNEIPRAYRVRASDKLNSDQLNSLRSGVQLEDGPAKFDEIVPENPGDRTRSNHWYRAVLHEGRNREVRRLFESQGVMINRLSRVSYGNVRLPKTLKPGQWQQLDQNAIKQLKSKLKN